MKVAVWEKSNEFGYNGWPSRCPSTSLTTWDWLPYLQKTLKTLTWKNWTSYNKHIIWRICESLTVWYHREDLAFKAAPVHAPVQHSTNADLDIRTCTPQPFLPKAIKSAGWRVDAEFVQLRTPGAEAEQGGASVIIIATCSAERQRDSLVRRQQWRSTACWRWHFNSWRGGASKKQQLRMSNYMKFERVRLF